MSAATPEIDDVSLPSTAGARLRGFDYGSIKPFLDVTLALAGLVISVPIIVICVIVVMLTSRGSAIYAQRRVGLGGKVFTIFKIRTMYQDCEQLTGARWSVPGDPRVTPVGRFLRFCHLDELPQLLNILRGDMSLVGPRPERPELVGQLERALPRYRERLAVRPGLTGLAQVQLPPDADLIGVRRKLAYDICYIEKMNFWLDSRLILATALKCLGVPFASIRHLLWLPVPRMEGGCAPLIAETDRASQSLVPDPYVGVN
jgi:lipopolysaccharide/colanic/teichoic acid biosynthesis glycosyltransferase